MPQVIVILGSETDWKVVEEAGMLEVFQGAEVSCEVSILSAHRHADMLREYCQVKVEEGGSVFIAIAGMAAVLASDILTAIESRRPVIGVPLPTGFPDGRDALLSMLQMPSGVPLAVCGAVGKAGIKNAALLACTIIGLGNTRVAKALKKYLPRVRAEKPPQVGIATCDPDRTPAIQIKGKE